MIRFAVCKSILAGVLTYQTPQEMLDALRGALADRVAQKKDELVCELVTGVRAFDDWMAPLGVVT